MTTKAEKRIKVERVMELIIPNQIAQYSTLVQSPEPLAVRRTGQEDSPVDKDMKKKLEQMRILNWATTAHQLYPLRTPGKGNRLLYAVSMAIWGNYVGTRILMKYMKMALGEPVLSEKIHERWMLKREKIGLSDSREQLNVEWERLRTLTNSPEFPEGRFEDIHVFVLAVVLNRPIVVLCQEQDCERDGASCSMNNLAGVYLPLVLNPTDRIKSPIVLGYCEHFMPLLGFDGCQDISRQALACVPIVTSDLKPLQVQFLDSEEQSAAANLLRDYLDLAEIRQPGINKNVLVAELHYLPPTDDDVIKDICTEQGLKRQRSQVVLAVSDESGSSSPGSSVEVCSAGCYPRGEADVSYEDDTCAYPHCAKHAVWWPFCFEHSPDSGWAPGGLLYCWDHFVNSKEKPIAPSSPSSMICIGDTPIDTRAKHNIQPEKSHSPVKKCIGPECEADDPGCYRGLCQKCYNKLAEKNKN